ncbi:restriction endonuclease subunit S [Acinetobacter oleivorans]|uniref:restriction endonuclease subunit S n=1 Tax=Acinetobacter oleivorans TaxID=1148157 RepID=UPI003F7CA414
MEKQKCPKIRFNSFNDAWNSKQIENILKIKSGMSQKHIEVERGIYPILATGGEIGRTNTPIYDKESVLIGRKGTIDKPYYMNSPFWTVDTLFYSELSSDVAGFFVYSLFQRINWRHHNTSTGVPSLTSSVIHAIDVNIPDKVEQTQIGNFFQNLDQSIALHEKKLAQTQNLKKAMLEKMFPKAGCKQPEIRLKGFSGDWEISILGERNDVRDGTHASPIYVKKGYPLVTSKNLSENGLDLKDVSFISEYDYKEINKRSKVDSGDILLALIGTIGNPVQVTFGNYAIKNMGLIKNGGYIKNEFLLPYLKSNLFLNYVSQKNTGNTQKFLGLDTLRSFEVLIPIVDEQIEIGKFFKKLDETLVLQHQQIQTLKNLKQAFLEKMFV